MDEIDGMNSGDKGGINSLIKLIRPKKNKETKKRRYNHDPNHMHWKLSHRQEN